MKVVNIIDGTAVAVLRLLEIAPLTGLNLPDVSREIVGRYSFAQAPSFSQEIVIDKGLQFGMGRFASDDEDIQIVSLNIYNDAIMANCYSTERALLVLKDLITWAEHKYQLRISSIPADRIRLASRLIAEFEPSFLRNFDGFNEIFKLATQQYQETYGLERPVEIARFQFDVDRSTISDSSYSALPAFVIERQLDTPFSVNRFWCQAPLHTEDHIKLLEGFE